MFMTEDLSPEVREAIARANARGGQTSRQRGGREAAQRGGEFEKLILSSCSNGTLRLIRLRNQASWLPSKEPGAGAKLTEQKGPFDFAGCVVHPARRGLGVFIDAKRMGADNASFPLNDPKKVKPHQKAALQLMGQSGAISGLLVLSVRVGAYLWLDWSHLYAPGRLGWDDRRWLHLGADNGGLVPFDRLLAAYLR